MSEVRKFKCQDCGNVSWTTTEKGCKACGSGNIKVLTESEQLQIDKSNSNKRLVRNSLIAFVIIVICFLTGILSVTTEGCTLPIDIVLFQNACLFGSFGATIGATLAVAVFTGLMVLIVKLIGYFLSKQK